MRPVWKKSILYQGILCAYARQRAPLTANERRILREQLMVVSAEVVATGAKKHKYFCHTKSLDVAFIWEASAQGGDYWRGIYYARDRPRRLKNSR